MLPGAVARAAFSYTTAAFSSTFLAEIGQNGTRWTAFSSTLGGVFFHLVALKPSAGAGCSVGNTIILGLRVASPSPQSSFEHLCLCLFRFFRGWSGVWLSMRGVWRRGSPTPGFLFFVGQGRGWFFAEKLPGRESCSCQRVLSHLGYFRMSGFSRFSFGRLLPCCWVVADNKCRKC